MINATPNTAMWWVHTVRTILHRIKADSVQLQRQQRYANRYPDLAPVVPVNERNTFYNRIEQEIPALVMVHGKFLRPHARFIDILEQIAKQQKPVPCYKPSQMWAEPDQIVTTHNQIGRTPTFDSEIFAVGHDVVKKPILVDNWDDWRCRMLCFALGMAAAGMGTIKDAETKMLKYFKILQDKFKEKYSLFDIMEVDVLMRQEILDEQNAERGTLSTSSRWYELLAEKTEKDGAARVLLFMSTVQTNKQAGMKRQAGGDDGSATPLQRPRLDDYNALTTTPEKSLINRAKRDRTKANKKLRAQGLLPPLDPPTWPPPPAPPTHDQLAQALANAAGLKGRGEGGNKGGKCGARGSKGNASSRGGAQRPPVNNQQRYPDGEHAMIMEMLAKPENAASVPGVCRNFNSSEGCSFGATCNFTNKCLMCGATDHGLQSCPLQQH